VCQSPELKPEQKLEGGGGGQEKKHFLVRKVGKGGNWSGWKGKRMVPKAKGAGPGIEKGYDAGGNSEGLES